MANTFKVKSNAAMPSSSGTPDTIYTCGASGGTVILGLVLANVHTSSVTAVSYTHLTLPTKRIV